MPKVHTSTARADIYRRGLRVPSDKTKSGFRLDRSKPADENDDVIVKGGETYYWWQFRYAPKVFSTTYPRRSQLTQSAFKKQMYDLEDSIAQFSGSADQIDEYIEEIDEMYSAAEESLQNMPEHLQDAGPAGEALQERMDALEEWKNELEAAKITLESAETEDDIEDAVLEVQNCCYNG